MPGLHRVRRTAAAGLLAIALVLDAVLASGLGIARIPAAAAAGDPTIVAAGDIACDPGDRNFNGGRGQSGLCVEMATSELALGAGAAAVLPLGDNVNYCGSAQAYAASYDPSWGRLRAISHPVPGNHDYITSPSSSVASTGCTSANAGAAGYFGYFGTAAGARGQGWYSYDLGAWHVIALNSNCGDAGGCAPGTPQGDWLAADLRAHAGRCILAYWHIPLFSSGGRAARNSATFWTALYAAHADVVLHGHEHMYERFAPQNPNGVADPAGIREFIAGTGGQNHTSVVSVAANSQIRDSTSFGVLELTLHAGSYDWRFVPATGTFTDAGTATCHNPAAGTSPSPTAPPTAPTASLTARTSDSAPPASAPPSPSGAPTVTPSPSPAPSPTTAPTATIAGSAIPAPTVQALLPVADAYVNAASPGTNYGTSTSLRVDGSPVTRSYLRFDLRGVTRPVTAATLRLYANSSLAAGFGVAATNGAAWTEGSITATNAPIAAAGASPVSSGAVATGSWKGVAVTALVNGHLGGYLDLVLTTSSVTQLNLASRESANKPVLEMRP